MRIVNGRGATDPPTSARGPRERRTRRLSRLIGAALAASLTAGCGSSSSGGSVAHINSPATSKGATKPETKLGPLTSLGAIPPLRAGAAHLYYSGPTARREIAITFDDGFCAACARRIIDYLLRSGEHASIFPNGMYATSWDPLAARIRELVARGQLTVGNHTFHHVDAVGVGPAAFGADLEEMWSGTLADSNLRTISYILHAIRYWAKPGAIILAHANYPPTSEVLDRIFAILRQEHLRPVTLAQLLGGSPYHAS